MLQSMVIIQQHKTSMKILNKLSDVYNDWIDKKRSDER